MRRLERRLVAHYEAMISDLLPALTAEGYDRAVTLASAPELVRGYEEVKLRNVAVYTERLAELGAAFTPVS
jgi:indolepyruvate ferredoxin oxidoreductase